MTGDWGTCLIRLDGLHCVHWYDGKDCCVCEDPATPVQDITLLYLNFGVDGMASTVVRDNATGQIIEIPGGRYEVIDRG